MLSAPPADVDITGTPGGYTVVMESGMPDFTQDIPLMHERLQECGFRASEETIADGACGIHGLLGTNKTLAE